MNILIVNTPNRSPTINVISYDFVFEQNKVKFAYPLITRNAKFFFHVTSNYSLHDVIGSSKGDG